MEFPVRRSRPICDRVVGLQVPGHERHAAGEIAARGYSASASLSREPLERADRRLFGAARRLLGHTRARVERIDSQVETARGRSHRPAVPRPAGPGRRGVAEPFADEDHHPAVGLQFPKPQRELAQGGGHDLGPRTRNRRRCPADVLLFEAAPWDQVTLAARERSERGVGQRCDRA